MLPEFNEDGNLPPGIHWADWEEFAYRFGWNTRRQALLSGLLEALEALKLALCQTVYIDGSFVTGKEWPNDFDGCWDASGVDVDRVDPVFWDFSPGRLAQKARFGGEFFLAHGMNGTTGLTFLEFFQIDRAGRAQGVVAIDLRSVPS